MKRDIPGTIEVDSREFLYIEIRDENDFRQLVDEAIAMQPDVSLPKSGGIIEEKVRVMLPDKTLLLGVSYKGDLQGCKDLLVSYCEKTERKWCVVHNASFVRSDGNMYSLDECVVEFQP